MDNIVAQYCKIVTITGISVNGFQKVHVVSVI